MKSKLYYPILALLVVCGVNEVAAQSAYDLRSVTVNSTTQSWVPDIQNQGIFGDCWTFASATAMNSNLLMSGVLSNTGTPPHIQLSSWHLSTANGAPESLVGPDYGGSGAAEWGGFEYQALGYATRGQGSWAIPFVSANSTTQITTMGGGPVFNSSNPLNPFPDVLQNSAPSNIGYLVPPANQPQAFIARSIRMWDQGYGNNVALPPPIHPGGDTYNFNQGAADSQVIAIKSAILSRGAITTSMNADYSYFVNLPNGNGTYTVEYFNPGKNPYNTDHEVTIIGWDDNYSMTDPNSNATYTGAWIVQNSWGRDYWVSSTNPYPNDGTFYAPYDDPSIGRVGVTAFAMEPMGNYSPEVLQNELGPMSYAFYYDEGQNPLGMHALSHNRVAGILTSPEDATLLALGLGSHLAGVDVTVNIYSDWNLGPDNLLLTEDFTMDGIGYQLNDLGTSLAMSAGSSLVIELIYSTPGAAPVVLGGTGLNGTTDVNSGLSYYYDGAQWHDMAGLVFASNDSNFDNLNGGILFLKGIVAIPEPGTYGFALVGMLLVLGFRHRIRSNQ